MVKSKKFIIIAVLAIVVLAGSIGGAVLADDGDDDAGQSFQRGGNLERVCEIYRENTGDEINCEELQNAFAQAAQERMTETRNQMRQRLLDDGTLTEEQLKALEEWQAARPDRDSDEFQAWLEDCPVDMPGPRFGGRGGDFDTQNGGRFFGRFPRFGGCWGSDA